MEVGGALPGGLAVGLEDGKGAQEGYLAYVLYEGFFLYIYIMFFHNIVYGGFVSIVYKTS